jgi:hypothetical protein
MKPEFITQTNYPTHCIIGAIRLFDVEKITSFDEENLDGQYVSVSKPCKMGQDVFCSAKVIPSGDCIGVCPIFAQDLDLEAFFSPL